MGFTQLTTKIFWSRQLRLSCYISLLAVCRYRRHGGTLIFVWELPGQLLESSVFGGTEIKQFDRISM